MTARSVFAAVAVLGLILTGCGSSTDDAATESTSSSSSPSSSTSSSGTDKGEAAVITIKDFKYEGPDSVAPGTMIKVTNEDDVPHTVTAEGDGGFEVRVEAGATATLKAPAKAGSYPYTCSFHPQMKGTLVVA
ncbi:MAG: cupredoxin domain-containing protein [Sporichthyaceae bacterium]